MIDPVKNFVIGFLSQGYDAEAFVMQVREEDQEKFMDPAIVGEYDLTLYNSSDYEDAALDPDVEIVRVVGKNHRLLTLFNQDGARVGQQDTAASPKNLPGRTYALVLSWTKKNVEQIIAALAEKMEYDDIVEYVQNVLSDYYTKDEIGSVLNSYYTRTDTDALLLNYASINHDHDGRYYQQNQVDAMISAIYEAINAQTFLGLDDTPDEYELHADELVKVNSTPDGLEFIRIGDLLNFEGPLHKGGPNDRDITIDRADGDTDGYLSSEDFIIFTNKEDAANKQTDFNAPDHTHYPSTQAVKDFAEGLVVGLLDDRGSYDPTITSQYPAAGGSGSGGQILKGDLWYISANGSIGGTPVLTGYSVRALVDSPGQTAANWDILQVGLGYLPENVANKMTDPALASADNTYYPSALAAKTYIDNGLAGKANTSHTHAQADITGLTSALAGKVSKAGDTMSGQLILPANGLLVGTTDIVVAAGRVGFGKNSSINASVDILALENIPAHIVRGKSGSSSNIRETYRANTAQLVEYINQYGTLVVYQPANSTGVVDFQADGNLGFSGLIRNVNVGANAGIIWNIATAGGGGAALTWSLPAVTYSAGGYQGTYGPNAVFVFAGQAGAGSRNDLVSFHNLSNTSYQATTYTGNLFNVGGRNLAAYTLTVENGDLAVYNAQPYGGGLGTEMLNTTLSTAKWSAANGFSLPGSTAVYAYHASGGTLTQTAANMPTATNIFKKNTVYCIEIVVTGTSGTHYLQIFDPAGQQGSPTSIQNARTAWQRIGSFAGRTIANGTHPYFFTTENVALTSTPLVIKATSVTASGGFTITSISIKEAKGGNIYYGGIIAAFGADYGMHMDMSGRVKIKAGVNDTISAWLELPAGSAAAGNAPLKFVAGTNLTAPEAGAVEFDGSDLFMTDSSPARRKITTEDKPAFVAAILMDPLATPATPAAGKNKLYFKSDDNLYKLNSAGVEVLVG